MWGGCSQVSGASTAWDMLPGLGSRELGPPVRNPTFTSPVAVRAKAPVVRDAIGAGYRFGEAASRFLELCLVGVGHRMCLSWLRSRELGPPPRNPDTHFSGTVSAKALYLKYF